MPEFEEEIPPKLGRAIMTEEKLFHVGIKALIEDNQGRK